MQVGSVPLTQVLELGDPKDVLLKSPRSLHGVAMSNVKAGDLFYVPVGHVCFFHASKPSWGLKMPAFLQADHTSQDVYALLLRDVTTLCKLWPVTKSVLQAIAEGLKGT